MFNIVKRYANLGGEFCVQVMPSPLSTPQLIHYNHTLAHDLNLESGKQQLHNLVNLLGGTATLKQYPALASLYAGHQFGVWVPELGDGRALLIAEHKDQHENIWELQTKGSGTTPFSRGADGRAVLRSSIREYLCSHAMASMGVPTTRALAIIGSNMPVYREQVETAAVILRVAPSFIRFGSFEVFAARKQTQQLRQLIDFVITNYYSEVSNTHFPELSFYQEVIKHTALMLAKWQALGFCHGVMNTDNMSILGLTLDYGPFGFMEEYNHDYICNHSDYHGRYAYVNQPYIAWWNLARLGEALLDIIPEEQVRSSLSGFSEHFTGYYLAEFGNKLGISDLGRGDLALVEELLAILAQHKIDWTIFWRQFSYQSSKPSLGVPQVLLNNTMYIEWLKKYQVRASKISNEERQKIMLQVNPAIVPRNYMLQQAISRAQSNDFSEVDRLFRALTNPYIESAEFRDYQGYPPQGTKSIPISCSS